MPAMIAVAFALGPRLMNQRSAPVRGQVAVIDPTGAVHDRAARDRSRRRRSRRGARRPRGARSRPCLPACATWPGSAVTAPSSAAIERIAGAVPDLQLVERPVEAGDPDLRAAKAWLTDAAPGDRHLALVVVQPDAVTPGAGACGVRHLRPLRAAQSRRSDRDRPSSRACARRSSTHACARNTWTVPASTRSCACHEPGRSP